MKSIDMAVGDRELAGFPMISLGYGFRAQTLRLRENFSTLNYSNPSFTSSTLTLYDNSGTSLSESHCATLHKKHTLLPWSTAEGDRIL